MFFFSIILFCPNIKGQTYKQSQSFIGLESSKLGDRLKEINDRIYYLEVTLPDRLVKTKNMNELRQLKKDEHFASEELKSLKAEKNKVSKALETMENVSLAGAQYRAETDIVSDVPKEMSQRTFKRSTRSQYYRVAEEIVNRTSDGSKAKKFEGILINYKRGRDEVDQFDINRLDVNGLPTISKLLDPEERLKLELLPGKYQIDVIYGSQIQSHYITVDPGIVKHADKQDVYFFAVAR